MNQRRWLNIGLLGLLLLLGLWVWLEARHNDALPRHPLTALTPAAVNKITIHRQGRDTIILTGQDNEWWLKAPVRIAANRFRVESLLGVVATESLARFAAQGKELADYGLAQPAVRATFNNTELVFGGMTPLDQRRYVLVGDTVHLIVDSYYFDFIADVVDFVGRNLVPTTQRISALSTPEFALKRGEAADWTVTPPDYFSSADAIQTLLDEWQHIQALRVSLYKTAPSLGTVKIGFNGQQQVLTYLITAQGAEWILARPEVGLQFHLSEEQARRLFVRDQAAGP